MNSTGSLSPAFEVGDMGEKTMPGAPEAVKAALDRLVKGMRLARVTTLGGDEPLLGGAVGSVLERTLPGGARRPPRRLSPAASRHRFYIGQLPDISTLA